MIKMMQGDSYVVFLNLTQQGQVLTPELVEEVEVCVGPVLRKTLSGGTVGFDGDRQQWYIRPDQRDTLAMEPGTYDVVARVKYANAEASDVRGVRVGRLVMAEACSREEI